MKRNRQAARNTRRGFTLLEVLLVLVILGVLGAMVVPQLLGQQRTAMVKATEASIKGLEKAVEYYTYQQDGNFPQGTEETVYELLLSNVDQETGQPVEPVLDDIPRDAWENALKYEYPPSGNHSGVGNKPAIWSVGPDGQDGTDDDITNWQQQGR